MINQMTDNKPKSFWERPEGTTGMISLGLLGLGGFFLFQAIGPAILGALTLATSIVGQTIVLVAGCVVLAALLFILTNKKFLTLCSYMFKSAMRKATSLFVEIDPIGIMKSYIDDLKDRKAVMDDRIAKLNGELRVCKNQIAKNAQEAQNALDTAKTARDKKMGNAFALASRNHGRLQQSNLTLTDLAKRMDLIYKALLKYRDAADIVIQDLGSEVKVREQERAMILSSHTAMRSAMAIMRGDGDRKELFDQAMEFVVEDYGRKLGEIEDFMNGSQPFIDSLDLQNGVYEEKALKQLEQWEQKADSILLGGEKRIMLEHLSTDMAVPVTISSTETVSVGDDYNKFFQK